MPQSPSPSPDAFRLAALRDARAHDLLRSLTDDVGPRFPGTPGDAAGVEWALATLAACGLRNVRAEPAPATLWRRGIERGATVTARRREVVLTALGGSVPTPAGGIEADVIEVPSLEALEKLARNEVEGRVVFLNHAMPRRRDGTGYNVASMGRMAGATRAARAGAVAFVVRSVGTDSARAAHAGSLIYDADVPAIPAAAISIPDAEHLHRLIEAGNRPKFSLELGCRPLPQGQSFNVVGEVPGTDLAHEIVLVGAHLDSWDQGTGALDDGAGCAIAIEVGRMLAARATRPRRTVRVALFANEELGVGGGKAYAEAHRAEADAHFVALEADQGDGRPWALRVPAGARDGAAAQELHRALEPLGIALDEGPSRGGVDIGPLRPLGVPFVDLRQDATRYFDFHHSPNDVLENVSRDDLEHAAAAFAVAAATLADMNARWR